MPRIVKYMSLMIILTAVVLVESIILKVITRPSQPLWVQKVSKFLAKNVIFKYFVISLFDDIETGTISEQTPENCVEIEASQPPEIKPKDDWTVICRFIDRVLFIALCVCYKLYAGY